jgi:hypothetical protein
MDTVGRVFDPALADYTEKTFHVHEGLRMSWRRPGPDVNGKKIGSRRKASGNGAGPNPVGEGTPWKVEQ